IAQAYGIVLPLGTQITMLLILMLTSKGMAGVPRASLVVIAATLNQFNIPEAGLLLILGVDTFLDMGRSATNAVGNSIDLCKLLVDAIGEAVGRTVAIKWQPVTSESRIPAVASGQVDLECGSTTNNVERQKQVGFSP